MFNECVCTRERVCVFACVCVPGVRSAACPACPLVCVCMTQTHSRASFLREFSRSVARVSAEGYSSQQTLPGLRTGVLAATNRSLLMRYICVFAVAGAQAWICVTDSQLISFFPKHLMSDS